MRTAAVLVGLLGLLVVMADAQYPAGRIRPYDCPSRGQYYDFRTLLLLPLFCGCNSLVDGHSSTSMLVLSGWKRVYQLDEDLV